MTNLPPPATHLPRLLGLAIASALSAPIALADDDANRDRDRDEETLATTEVIGERPLPDVQDRIQRGQAATVRDLFDLDARVNFGGGTRNGQRLYVRGIEGSNLNVTVDGARQGQNLYNHRGGQGNVDPDILKRIDIAPGPVSADAGYGALAGSVRFTTIDAQDRLDGDDTFGSAARFGYASSNEATRASAMAYGLAGDLVGVLLHASARNYDHQRIGGGERIPYSDGQDRSALLKLSVLDAEGHTLRVGIDANRASGYNYMQRGDYPWQVQPPVGTRPPQEQTLTRYAQTARYRYAPGSDLLDLQLNVANSKDEFHAPNSNGERFTSKGRSIDLRNVLRWSHAQFDTDLTVGLEWVEQKGTAEQRVGTTFFATGNDNLGAYAQARASGEHWDLSFGARRDRYDSDYGVRSSDGHANSLNAQAQWRFDNGLRIHGGYGEAIRGVGSIPLQFTRNIADDLVFNGDPDGVLRPERGRQSELGLAYVADDVLGARVFEVGLRRYLTRLQDVIVFDQPGTGGLGGRPVRGFSNLQPSVRFEGTELSVRWSGERIDSSVSAIDARTRNLPLQAQFLARTGAPTRGQLVWDTRFALTSDWTLGYTFTAAEGLDKAPTGQAVFIERPGYSLHDVQVTWRAPGPRQWGVAFAVHNLFDREYSNLTTFTEQGFATAEPGRDIRVTVDFAF